MQQFLGAFTAARVTYGGFYMLGAVGALFNVAIAAPIGLVAGLTLGRRLVKQERERQVQQRRQQARAELRRYVDDVAFHVGRDSREAVRRTQRLPARRVRRPGRGGRALRGGSRRGGPRDGGAARRRAPGPSPPSSPPSRAGTGPAGIERS